MAQGPRPGKQDGKKEWYIRTKPMPAYDVITCNNCGIENKAPNETCVNCGATLPWEEEQEKYNNGLVSVLAYTRPGGIPGQYQLWLIQESTYMSPSQVFGGPSFAKGHPWNMLIVPEELALTGNEGRSISYPSDWSVEGIHRAIYAFNHFTPGYLMQVRWGIRDVAPSQECYFKATPKGVVGGLEEKSIYVAPLLLVDLDNIDAFYRGMTSVTVEKVRVLIERIVALRASFIIPYCYSVQEMYANYGKSREYDETNPLAKAQQQFNGEIRELYEPKLETLYRQDLKTGHSFGFMNTEAALVVYMDESFEGKLVSSVRNGGGAAAGASAGSDYVKKYNNGKETCYAAIFAGIYIPYVPGTKRPEPSENITIRVSKWSRLSVDPDKEEISVTVYPGQAMTVNWTYIRYKDE